MRVSFIATGATIVSLEVPSCGPKKTPLDVALGYSDLKDYPRDPHPSFGAIVGRVANRISNAAFMLDGHTYKLLANEGTSSIHGGAVRLSKANWTAEAAADGKSIVFTYTSVDGESGYPGSLTSRVKYALPDSGSHLDVTMTATTTKPTPVNLLGHTYFNLKGAGRGTILDHEIAMVPSYYTPAAQGKLLPTGAIEPVRGTVYDLRKGLGPKTIGLRASRANGGPYKGYDLNYAMPPGRSSARSTQGGAWWVAGANPQVSPERAAAPLVLGAMVTAPNGLRLEVSTDAPGIHLYTGNFLDGTPKSAAGPGKGMNGKYYPQYGGFCIETQAFPNAINTPAFPSPVVRPGQTYTHRVRYAFSCT